MYSSDDNKNDSFECQLYVDFYLQPTTFSLCRLEPGSGPPKCKPVCSMRYVHGSWVQACVATNAGPAN